MGSKDENMNEQLSNQNDQPLVNATEETEHMGEPLENQTPSPPENKRLIMVSWRELAVGAAAAGAVSLIFGYVIPPTMARVDEVPRTATPPIAGPPAPPSQPTHRQLDLPIAPEVSYSPSFDGYTCASDSRTIKLGETIYGLTTQGLVGNQTFAGTIFEWNLRYLHEQSIANPNNMTAGAKFKILDDCISYGPVEEYGFYSNVTGTSTSSIYGRELEYQSYKGTDNKTHADTTIFFATSDAGEFDKVLQCDPSPGCYTYVAGAPTHPPLGTYIP